MTAAAAGFNPCGQPVAASQMILRFSNGVVNMPIYAGNITQADMDAIVAFLQKRKTQRP